MRYQKISAVPGSQKNAHGFTLFELLVAVVILVIMTTIAIPGLSAQIQNSRANAALFEMFSTLSLARSEAIKRGHRVGLCPSSNGLSCNNSFRWHNGWILFKDPDRNGMPDTANTLIIYHNVDINIRILTTSGRRKVIYQPDGTVTGNSNMTMTFCRPLTNQYPDQIVQSQSGRIRVNKKVRAGASLCQKTAG
ncbi:MAG TPA: prepilin-type N-terminal cleavage/methylation domain-containing protein [Gammaproteobacteria bacterium]|nr:prepilin-type N-terminal cleavage/methylation domain-containing protein [Gammaproteobacteria bacterium]